MVYNGTEQNRTQASFFICFMIKNPLNSPRIDFFFLKQTLFSRRARESSACSTLKKTRLNYPITIIFTLQEKFDLHQIYILGESMMQKVQTKVKSRSKMVQFIPHLPTNLQPHVNWYSPHKSCFFNQSHCVLYRNFIIINDK